MRGRPKTEKGEETSYPNLESKEHPIRHAAHSDLTNLIVPGPS